MCNREGGDSDPEEEEDGDAVPNGDEGALSCAADSVASQPSDQSAAQPAAQPAVQPNPGPVVPNNVDDFPPYIPNGRSFAHLAMEAKKVVYLSFGIETGGGYCGILKCWVSLSDWIWKAQNSGPTPQPIFGGNQTPSAYT